MGVSPLSNLRTDLEAPQQPNAASPDVGGRFSKPPGQSCTIDLESNPVWIAILQRERDAAADHFSLWDILRGAKRSDPKRLEVEEADWRALLEALRRSYARRADTVIWSTIVFIIAAATLLPIIGFIWGPAYAALVSLSWAVVHRVRRI